MSTEGLEYVGCCVLAFACVIWAYFRERRDHRRTIERIRRRVEE